VSKSRLRHPKSYYREGILKGNRVALSKAITLAESKLLDDNSLSEEIINELLPHTGNSLRVGITGIPGVGKSTFIESFGNKVAAEGKKIAVLAIDPSSQRTKGSILGDKTRMDTLVRNPNAYIRPSPTGETLGGVANKTRETMLLCEAAGFDVIVVETVGVGQSETAVHDMVDFFLLLAIAGAGDELQGIKKGIIEMADAIVINKADGENKKEVQKTKANFTNALHFFAPNNQNWPIQVLTCSALLGTGIQDVWKLILDHEHQMKTNGHFYENRKKQNLKWFDSQINESLHQMILRDKKIQEQLPQLKKAVLDEIIHPKAAVRQLLADYLTKE
jgi:LAO/AO transport system kinase